MTSSSTAASTLIILNLGDEETRTNAVFVLFFSLSPPKLQIQGEQGRKVFLLGLLFPLLLPLPLPMYIVLSNVDAFFGSCAMMLWFFALAVQSFFASSPPHLDH